MSQVYFQGQYYDTDSLPPEIVLYIETYNKVTTSAPIIDPNTRDYDYRMSQALQMFGDPVVVDSIQDLIDNPQYFGL